VATLTKTLKLPFLRLNQTKAEMFARLERLNTEVANAILALPKDHRRALTSKSFAGVEIGSAWINQTIRNANARTHVKRFLRLPLETNNQNWRLHRTGATFSLGFGLLRGIKKRVPLEVHAASHRDALTALWEGRAKAGSLMLVRSKKGIWYACLSVSMDVPDAENTGRWVGVDRGQNIPVAAATPDGPVVFWKAARMRHVRRIYAERRCKLQKAGKRRAVKKSGVEGTANRHAHQSLHQQGSCGIGETSGGGVDSGKSRRHQGPVETTARDQIRCRTEPRLLALLSA
jgi:hypothetical protein